METKTLNHVGPMLLCIVCFKSLCRNEDLKPLSTKSILAHLHFIVQKNYSKSGYFRCGKILRKCWQDISRGGNFYETTPISFIKECEFYFRVGVIFAKKTRARKTRKLPLRENFHIYSIALPTVSAFTCTCTTM